MKHLLKQILAWKLRFWATRILKKYRPKIVAVTGSVGKTSTVEAIYTVLAADFNVRKNLKNYNNEIGIPLSIIGVESGNAKLGRWITILLRAARLAIVRDRHYPKILILEMGADHPGDLEYLCRFVPIDVAVVTSVAPAHLEFFKTIEAVAREKGTIVRRLPANGTAVLNTDDRLVKKMGANTKAKTLSYGLLSGAAVRATDLSISQAGERINGLNFKLTHNGKTTPILLPNVIAQHLAYSALAAVAVGLTFEMSRRTITERLTHFQPPTGRMRLIPGLKNTLIIDDSYNSSPLAAQKALWQLGNLKTKGRRFAVLGDMLELGSYTETGHQEVGAAAAEYGVDYLITVGEMSRDMVRGAIKKGLGKNNCFNFPTSTEAGKFLQQQIGPGDLILVKGSQGVRMERVVKELMAEPQRAGELLVRQGRDWK